MIRNGGGKIQFTSVAKFTLYHCSKSVIAEIDLWIYWFSNKIRQTIRNFLNYGLSHLSQVDLMSDPPTHVWNIILGPTKHFGIVNLATSLPKALQLHDDEWYKKHSNCVCVSDRQVRSQKYLHLHPGRILSRECFCLTKLSSRRHSVIGARSIRIIFAIPRLIKINSGSGHVLISKIIDPQSSVISPVAKEVPME